MVFKSDFSFDPRPVTPTGPRSRAISPKASCGRTPCLEDGEVSPSSKDPSVISAWSSKRSSMTSLTYSLRRECHLYASTAYAESVAESMVESVIDNGPVISPIRIRFHDESYGYGEESDDPEMGKKGKAAAIKASILRGFRPFPFHNNVMKKTGSAPASPKSPETSPVRASTKPNTQNTRAIVNTRFRLFKSAPKSNKNNRRPPPLDLQSSPKISSSLLIREVEKPSLASPIKLDTHISDSEYYNFTKSPEAGIQLLFQTLSEESGQEDTLEVEHPKGRKITRNYNCHENIIPAHLSSPWFITSQEPSQMSEMAEKIESTNIKFPKSCLPIPSKPERVLGSSVFSMSPKNKQKAASALGDALLMPDSPIIQPPTPRSAGSTMSFLFDEDEDTDIEDTPVNFYTRKLSPAPSRGSSLSFSRRSSISRSRKSSISRSRKSSISGSRKSSVATFFCRGQRPSLDRQNSIGFCGLTGDEVEIKDDAESIFYLGVKELKSKSSWLYTNPPEYYSSDDEDEEEEDDDSEIEEAYQHHLSLITQMRQGSISSLATSITSTTSTPELTMSSSISSMSSYGQMLETPSGRRNRRRTASSECIVLEALEEMQTGGKKDLEGVEKRKSRRFGFMGDMDISSEWADALWEMDSDEQAGVWDWENQKVALIGI